MIIHPHWRKRNQCFMNRQLSTSISGKRKPENHKGEGEGRSSSLSEPVDVVLAVNRHAAISSLSQSTRMALPHGCGMFFCLSHSRISPISRLWVSMISRARCLLRGSLPNFRTVSATSIAPWW